MSTPSMARWAAFWVFALIAIARSQSPAQAAVSEAAAQASGPDSLLPAASAGDAKAQFALAEFYFRNRYSTLGYAEAVAWYRKSAAQGYAPAQDRTGCMYEDNTGLPMRAGTMTICTISAASELRISKLFKWDPRMMRRPLPRAPYR